MATYLNYTPHAVRLNDGREFPSLGVARVSNSFVEVTFGDLVGLPEPEQGTYYIVSALVLSAAKAAGRKDCVAPATGHTSCKRDDKGFIVSVPGVVFFFKIFKS